MMFTELWPTDISEARKVQDILSGKVRIMCLRKTPEYIAGVDCSFFDDIVIAVASLFRYQEMIHCEDACCIQTTSFPYVPGYLTFREGPAIMNVLKQLRIQPDALMVDGQGISHPKGIGIASHIGVLLHMPTIGCAKSRLVGEYIEPDENKGSWKYLLYRGRKVGAVVRTRTSVKPLFVSPGHLVNIDSARKIIMHTVSQYRIPEPLRRADQISRKLKREKIEKSH
jgi:deoxyribonuclease V